MLELPLWVRLRAEAGEPTDFKTLTRIKKFLRVTTKTEVATWKFDGKEVRIKTDKNGKEWFCGRDVCLILGFKNIKRTQQVKKAYKCSLKDLAVGPESGPLPDPNNEGTFTEPPGILSLVLIFLSCWRFKQQQMQSRVNTVVDNTTTWFCGKDVCVVLEWVDAKKTLQKYAAQEDKTQLKTLRPDAPYHEGKEVYLTARGVQNLAARSKSPFAQELKDWAATHTTGVAMDVVMPELRGRKEQAAPFEQQVAKAKGFGVWKWQDQKVDIQGTIDEPYFNGRDVCAILGYKKSNKKIQEHLDQDERKPLSELTPGAGVNYHQGKAVYVSESGLYSLIFGSRRTAVKSFKKWVTSEVLPSIQKTGGYEIQALKDEMMLKEKEHAEEISKAMEQLSIKNTQIAAKDEEHKTQIAVQTIYVQTLIIDEQQC